MLILTLLKLIVNKLLKVLFIIFNKTAHLIKKIISQSISRKKIIRRLIAKNKNFYINSHTQSKYNFFRSYKKKLTRFLRKKIIKNHNINKSNQYKLYNRIIDKRCALKKSISQKSHFNTLNFTYISHNQKSYNLYIYYVKYFSKKKNQNKQQKIQNLMRISIFDLIFDLMQSIFQLFFIIIFFFLSLVSLFMITVLPDLIKILTHRLNDKNQSFYEDVQHNFEQFFTFKSFEKVGNTIPLSLSPSSPS